MSTASIILGNQLFPPAIAKKSLVDPIFMAEDHELCTYFKFHKHKITLFLSAMRQYADQLSHAGYDINYQKLSNKNKHQSYEAKLAQFVKKYKVTQLVCWEIEDKFFESRLQMFCQSKNVSLLIQPSPMFMVDREQFSHYVQSRKRPFMKTFYEQQRKATGILMNSDKPVGGKYSYDMDNRKKLPKSINIPKLNPAKPNATDQTVMRLVNELFHDHPGDAAGFWLPTDRKRILKWMDGFFNQRFSQYGDYQDAITNREPFLFHAVISPFMNMGLITPAETISRALKAHNNGAAPLNAVEGFIRQVLGWREFVRGIYQNFSGRMEAENYWQHHRGLKSCWYTGNTGLPPVDQAIQKAIQYGYNHHIERLMILANIFNLCEVKPRQVYQWFMEMYVDSSDWVMQANVFGMGLMSEGGIFATKPYISGSNYILKMSDYKKGPWTDIWDGLYWRFVEKNRSFFSGNPRMNMMVKTLERMKPEKKETIFKAAESFILNTTTKK